MSFKLRWEWRVSRRKADESMDHADNNSSDYGYYSASCDSKSCVSGYNNLDQPTSHPPHHHHQQQQKQQPSPAVHSALDCPVCFFPYSSEPHRHPRHRPCVLPCGHTICLFCKDRVSRCPICRTLLPHHSKHALPINYALISIIDSQDIRSRSLSRNHRDLSSERHSFHPTNPFKDLIENSEDARASPRSKSATRNSHHISPSQKLSLVEEKPDTPPPPPIPPKVPLDNHFIDVIRSPETLPRRIINCPVEVSKPLSISIPNSKARASPSKEPTHISSEEIQQIVSRRKATTR